MQKLNQIFQRYLELLKSYTANKTISITNFLTSLNEKECQFIAQQAINTLENEELLKDILLHLAIFTNGNSLKTIYDTLIKRKIFYPCEIYKHADYNIANQLINDIQNETNTLNINHLLICLAWIGTPNVIDFFIRADDIKPAWTNNLHVKVQRYAEEAGWTIDADHKKKFLINFEVIALTKNTAFSKPSNTIQTFLKQQDKCKFCDNSLITVVETELHQIKTKFTTCLLCSCYEPLFMQIKKNGTSEWHPKNKKWPYLPENLQLMPIPENILKVSTEHREPTYTINQFVDISKSQIGGFPTWIQDADYLKCPNCDQLMQFIAQIDMQDVQKYGDGIYYFHYCPNCNITGTNYQQS